MNRLFRVQHKKVNSGQIHLLQNRIVPAATAVEALFVASRNALQYNSTFISLDTATVERLVDGAKDLWCAVREL
jgi:hypothetical protein